MKRTLIIISAALIAALGTSCGESDLNTSSYDSKAVIQITSKAAMRPDDININEEIVKKATKPNQNTTEPTSATEPKKTKKKKKKKKIKKLPTQGDVNPNANNIQVATEPDGSFDDSDLDFVFEGAFIYLNDDIEDALAILGEDIGATEISKSQTEYEFDDLYVVSYEKNDKERVEEITVTSEDLPTAKGAKVGMYGTKLRTVYGAPTKKSDTSYSYIKGNKSLVFNIENNIVTSYSYILSH